MAEFNPSLARQPVVGHTGGQMPVYTGYQHPLSGDAEAMGKWPVWVRLLIIIGLSAGLWALIIAGFIAIF